MISTARVNGCFSVVSKCAYENTRDLEQGIEQWNRKELILQKENANKNDQSQTDKIIEFEKRDFQILNTQRYFILRSFDFVVESVGVFEPTEIVLKSCISLQNQCVDFIENLKESPETIIFLSGSTKDYSTMENSYDVLFFGITSNLGNILNETLHFLKKKTKTENEMSYCSFKKIHPHDNYYVLRIAFEKKITIDELSPILIQATVDVGEIFEKIHKLFTP
jgi:hypothetical protein